jgi:hypothetical protein
MLHDSKIYYTSLITKKHHMEIKVDRAVKQNRQHIINHIPKANDFWERQYEHTFREIQSPQ